MSAPAASAHVEPSPPAVQAGTAATIEFNVEHGCGTSPTTSVAFKIPDTISDAKPVAKAGWTTAVAAGVVTFSGGSLDPKTSDDFDLTFTAPATVGSVTIPVVQTCVTGENSWIDIAAEGKPEPDFPAPVIKITAGPPTAADLAVADDDAMHEHSDSHTGLIVGIVVAVVAVAGGAGGLVLRSKRRTRPSR